MVKPVRMTSLACVVLLAGALGLAGCARQEHPSAYQAFGGLVKALDVETGEVFVRAEQSLESWRAGRDIPCVVTKDSEVYVNDRFSQIGDIRVGDAVDVVGYRDGDHLVLSFVTVARSQPDPPAPRLSISTSQPLTRPPED